MLFAALAVVLGSAAAGLLLGWDQIDPANLAWLKVDPALYQTGWEFLRWEPWHFPPTWLDRLDFPFGISAAYLDVIPLVAVPFKLLSPLLPENFQYLGFYALLCLVLQMYFALRLMAQFSTDRVLVLLGALFFLLSPILLMRLLGHFSLCSQWLIVAALHYYFRPMRPHHIAAYLRPFAVLLVLSGGVSPYLSVMVLGISAAGIARAWLARPGALEIGATERRRFSLLERPLAWAGFFPLCLLLSLWFFGFLLPGHMPAASAAGYGGFSMNLLGPLNPNGASLLFKPFPVLPLQGFEGYNYLGAGVILLGVLTLSRDASLTKRLWSPSLRPVVVLSFIFVLLSLSVRVTLGTAVIAVLPLPHPLVSLLAVFRSSGRFFWPVHELLTLGAIVGALATFRREWAARIVIAVALLVQYFDVLPVGETVARESARTASSPLAAPEWQTLSLSHVHLVLVPAVQCDPVHTPGGDAAWPWFSRLAARKGMTINSVHAARSSRESDNYNCIVLPRQIAQGRLERDTAYVLGDPLARLAVERGQTNVCRRLDGFNLCVVGRDR